jgi:hypothetical protein
MSFLSRFPLFRQTVRVEPLGDDFGASDTEKLEEIYDFLVSQGIGALPAGKQSFLAAIKERAGSKKIRYAEYEDIARDPLIVQPIEMMVDDATVMDEDREMTFWVESKDEEFAKKANAFLAASMP